MVTLLPLQAKDAGRISAPGSFGDRYVAPPKHTLIVTPAHFLIGLALLLLLVFWQVRPDHSGDFPEYASMTAAIAAHGTPAIRPADMAETARLAPNPVLTALSSQFA